MLNNQFSVDINTLPEEILTLIFSYLSPRDLLNKALVKKVWQSVSNEPAQQSELQPLPVQDMLTSVVKRKVGREEIDSEREIIDDESPKIKRAKLGS